jgi:formate hydrogenlyase subunit 4
MMNEILFIILNITLVIALSPLFMTVIKKVKARCQGRRGPPLLQGYYTLAKLFKKETVYSSHASGIMRIAPLLNLTILLVAALAVPLVFIPNQMSAFGNIILLLYLLTLAKFFMALAGLDAGSTFGGMGSSREMTITAIFEPIIIIVFAALAFLMKTMNIHEMFTMATETNLAFTHPSLILLSASLFLIIIIETARIPVDNPETHLELTMVHEAMILEQSGKNLALMELSHAIKQTLLMTLFINLLLPFSLVTVLSGTGILIGIAVFIAEALLLSVVIGLFESSLAKLRLFRLPSLFMIAFFFSFLTILLEVLR